MTCACKLLPNNDPSTRESDPQVIISFLLFSEFFNESSDYSDSQTTKLSLIDFFKYFFGNISKKILIEFFNTISTITILRTGSGCVEDLWLGLELGLLCCSMQILLFLCTAVQVIIFLPRSRSYSFSFHLVASPAFSKFCETRNLN